MFYKKGLDITNTKQMFEFLRNHYMYDTEIIICMIQ